MKFLLACLTCGLFILGLIAILVCNRFLSDNERNKKTVLGIIISALVAIIGIYSIISWFATDTKTNKQKITSYDLVALEDAQGEDFHYEKHIFSMRIDKQDIPEYRFYYRDSDGDIEYEKKSVKEISLVYPDELSYYEVIRHSTISCNSFFGFIPSYLETDIWYEYKLHLPEGSLVTDINIDMK